MRNGVFVEGLSNVTRFLSGTRTLEARGAREANWLLVEGEAGFGKTNTLYWYSLKKNAAFIRAKAGWTPHWLLSDLAEALGVQRAATTERLFGNVMPELMVQANERQLVLVIDEIDHAARSGRVLETLRDLTDTSEVPLIAVGMKGAQPLIKRYPQIHSRLADVVTFHPATVDDVKLMCSELSDVKIADDLADEIQKRTGGRLRNVKNAIARVEHAFRRDRGTVKLEDWRATKKQLLAQSTQPREQADA